MRVLVTGGTGKLGRQLLPKLRQAGYEVVALSRQPLPADAPASYAPGDLSTGEGIDDAVRGCNAVVHAATAGFGDRYTLRWAVFHRAGVDVRGTQMLLDAARRWGIRHFLLTSIVGMDRVPYWPNIYRYFKHKLAAEHLVSEASMSWTIVRITPFSPLLDQVFRWQFGLPGPVVVLDARAQPIDPSDAADAVVARLGSDPTREVVDTWTGRRGVNRKAHIWRAPGKMGRAMAEGALTCPDNATGTVTWAEWLSRN